jgi:hypothetical protein
MRKVKIFIGHKEEVSSPENLSFSFASATHGHYLLVIIKAKGFLPIFWGFHLSSILQGLPPISQKKRFITKSIRKPQFTVLSMPSTSVPLMGHRCMVGLHSSLPRQVHGP